MRIFITGICGFAGSTLARALLESVENLQIAGMDNFIRPGSELNRPELAKLGVKIFHADVRNAADFESLPAADFVIDAAANPSVLAGVDGKTSSRQLLEHNLWGTVNVLEYCKAHRAGLILLSTSRVYSVPPLAALPVEIHQRAFRPKTKCKIAGRIDRRRRQREIFHRAAGFALRLQQARQRNHRAGIRGDVSISRLDQPLRRAGGRGTIRKAGPGNFFILDQFAFAPTPAEIHRLRRARPSSPRLPASARPRSGVARANETSRQKQTAHCQFQRWRGKCHVARATDGLVRRAFRQTRRGQRSQSRVRSTFRGWFWIRRWRKKPGTGRRKFRWRKFWTKSPGTRSRIQTGWKFQLVETVLLTPIKRYCQKTPKNCNGSTSSDSAGTSAYRNRVWRVLDHFVFQPWIPAGRRRAGSRLRLRRIHQQHRGAAEKYAMDLNPDAPKHLSGTVRFFEQDCSGDVAVARRNAGHGVHQQFFRTFAGQGMPQADTETGVPVLETRRTTDCHGTEHQVSARPILGFF